MPQPCMGSMARVFRMSRSKVPWSNVLFSAEAGIFPSAIDKMKIEVARSLVDCQGEIFAAPDRTFRETQQSSSLLVRQRMRGKLLAEIPGQVGNQAQLFGQWRGNLAILKR